MSDITITDAIVQLCQTIWNDVKTGDVPLYVLLSLLCIYLLVKHGKELGNWIKDLFIIYLKNKKPSRREKSLKDLKEHPIFGDLVFWKENSIDQILNHGDIGKLELAKRMLYIQLDTAHSWLKDLIENMDYSKPISIIQQQVTREFEKIQAKKWTRFKEADIPEALLAKFNVINAMSKDYISAKIKLIFAEDCLLGIYEKFNILLNDMDAYYSTLLFDLPKTIQVLNGDLNGIRVKLRDGSEVTIGGGNPTKFLPPSLTFVTFAENRLTEVLNKCRAARVLLYAFHNIPCTGDCKTDILDSQYSAVYEVTSAGVAHTINKSTYQKSIMLAEYIHSMQEGNTIFSKTEECVVELKQSFFKKGVEAFLLSPVSLNSKLIGFMCVQWLDSNLVDNLDIEGLKTFVHLATTKVTSYIDYNNNNNF